MKNVITLLLIISFYSQMQAQEIGLVNRNWVAAMSLNNSDTTYVINFWATWCKPCVDELPAFEKIGEQYKDEKVKILLVSCDFKKQLTQRVVPFVKQKKLKSSVVLMDESDPNSWIEKVDSRFTGAIPATLIINGKKDFRFFKEGEISFDELNTIIKPLTQ